MPPREPKAIAAAIARLLRDDELREAMGAAGRERAEEFSWERVTAKVDDYYGFVIRRLAARGELPAGFHAADPAVASAARGARAAGGRPSTRRTSGARSARRIAAPAASGRLAAGRRLRPPRAAGRAQLGVRSPAPARRAPAARPTPSSRRRGRNTTRPPSRTAGPARRARSSRPRDVVDRELERVEVGRQDALVDVRDRRRQRQRAEVRVDDDEPADDRDERADHESAGVPGGRDERGDQDGGQGQDDRDGLDRDPVEGSAAASPSTAGRATSRGSPPAAVEQAA